MLLQLFQSLGFGGGIGGRIAPAYMKESTTDLDALNLINFFAIASEFLIEVH